MGRQQSRTVLGVKLHRESLDSWSVNGWTFQAAEGESVAGSQEWRVYSPDAKLTITGSLHGAVKHMLLVQREQERQAS